MCIRHLLQLTSEDKGVHSIAKALLQSKFIEFYTQPGRLNFVWYTYTYGTQIS